MPTLWEPNRKWVEYHCNIWDCMPSAVIVMCGREAEGSGRTLGQVGQQGSRHAHLAVRQWDNRGAMGKVGDSGHIVGKWENWSRKTKNFEPVKQKPVSQWALYNGCNGSLESRGIEDSVPLERRKAVWGQ